MTEVAQTCLVLVKRLASEGARLWVEDDQLRFRAAPGALTPADLDELRCHRDDVKAVLVAQGCLSVAYPTSEGQRAQWFIHDFLGADDPAYHLLAAVQLLPDISLARLRGAIAGLIERHEILRSRYLLQAGVLWQAPTAVGDDSLTVHVIDKGETSLRASLDAFAGSAFDLRRGIVFRAAVFEQPSSTEPRRVLAIAMHHIAADFLSLQELLLELQRAIAGDPLPPAEPFREAVRHGGTNPEASGRMDALAALLRPLPEATHLASREMLDQRGGHARLQWERGGAEGRRLTAAAASLGVTPFAMCFTAALIAASGLLHRENFGINLATAAPRSTGMIGDFANFMPFVARVRRSHSLRDLVGSTFSTTHQLLRFADIPFRDIVTHLGLTGHDPISPFSQLAFAWHREGARNARAAASLGEILPESRQMGAPGAAMLTGREHRTGFGFALVYRDAWLDADWAERFRDAFDAALTAIVEHPDSTVASVLGPDLPTADHPPASGDAGNGVHPRPTGRGNRGDRAAVVAILTALIREIAGTTVTNTDASVFDLGITSMSLIELRDAIRRQLEIDVPLATLFELATIDAIAGWLAGEEARPADHVADQALPVPRSCVAPTDAAAPRRILLTGATGFLGSRILCHLLARPEVRPICLVRAGDARTARIRLVRSLARGGIVLGQEAINRVEIIPGHVGSDRLSQDAATYDRLAHDVDAVVHAAAQVNFALPYRALRGNVLGALEIARLCMDRRPKPLHFVSTYSLLDPSEPVNAERLDVPEHTFLELGYARSKWVAEHLLLRASENGLRCRIYRPSRIITGQVGDPLNRQDFYSLLLAGSAAARAVPVNAGFDNFVDVAGVSAVIADAATRPVGETRAVHLCAGTWTAWSEVVELLDDVAPGFERLDYPVWVERVLSVAARDPALAGLSHLRPFLVGAADRLRRCLLHCHPEIERDAASAWPALDVRFDRRLVADHYLQVTRPELASGSDPASAFTSEREEA